MSILILGDRFTFPEGNAATNRVYAYAKGFLENGINVHVISFGNEFAEQLAGSIEGIHYYHPFHNGESKSVIIRLWFKFLKYIRTFCLISELNRYERILTIHLYTHRFFLELLICLYARILSINTTLERSEHPLQDTGNNRLKFKSETLKIALEEKLTDGVFCISEYLVKFYLQAGFKKEKILLVPSTVDPGRFKDIGRSKLSYEYILYCGSLTILKDGVNILIESFAKISERYPHINLVLIGRGDSAIEEAEIKELVNNLGLRERVVFLGYISRTEIPTYLCNAKILALARPRSMIADAGFPSKLSEYLSTGKPVVVTSVGEIPIYLKDNENAFFSDPNSVAAFADRLDFVLTNYGFALEVGSRGKVLTEEVFNYNYQAKRSIAFLKTL